MTVPLVDRRMVFPSGLNLSPVHSHPFSAVSLKEANGPWKLIEHYFMLFSQINWTHILCQMIADHRVSHFLN